ncbi:MAG: PAS domain-containing protein, partial [Pseudomonadales bacterium]|nr:PAS domain-containing protein [Pseudomonadales bacterium]
MVEGSIESLGLTYWMMGLTMAAVAVFAGAGVHLLHWYGARRSARSAQAEAEVHATVLAALAEDARQTVLVLDQAGAIQAVFGADGALALDPGLELEPGRFLLEAVPEALQEPLRCLFELARRSPGERVTQRMPRNRDSTSGSDLEVSASDRRHEPSFRGIVVVLGAAADDRQTPSPDSSPSSLDAVFRQAAMPIFLLEGPTGMIVDLNSAAEEIYGWPRGELLQRSFELISAAERREEGEPLWAGSAAGTDGIEHAIHRRRDGRRLLVRVGSAVVAGEDGPRKLVLVDNVDASVRAHHLMAGEL